MPDGPGLRERKRTATRRRIGDAARALVLECGFEHTTIDAIAARAEVAPRTFFNHFDSKEDAVLGLEQVDLDPATIAAHVDALAGRPAAEAVVALVLRVFGLEFADAALRRARREVLARFPQLLRRQTAHMTTTSEALAEAVRTLLARDPAWGPEAATGEAADMLLGMCMSALRATVRAQPGAVADAASLERRVTALMQDTASRIR